jgi:hypothetical protein
MKMKHTVYSLASAIETAYNHERTRLDGARRAAHLCSHPDDLITLGAAYKAQAARVNVLETLIYDLLTQSNESEHDPNYHVFTVETVERLVGDPQA